jgi:hypothetical protein
MTQTIEHQIERRLNFDYWYEAAKRALSSKDYSNATSLAMKGLNEAKDLDDKKWMELFKEFLTKLPGTKTKEKAYLLSDVDKRIQELEAKESSEEWMQHAIESTKSESDQKPLKQVYKRIFLEKFKSLTKKLGATIPIKRAIQKIELKNNLVKFGKAGKKVLKKSYRSLKKFIETKKAEKDKEEEEVIRLREIMILKESVDQLLAQDYYYINLKKNPQKDYPELDLFAIKQLEGGKGTSLIILHPIRYLKTDKPLFITKDRVKSRREDELPSSHASNLEELSKTYFKMKSNLSKGGILFKVIKNEYYPNLKLKTTITGKPFFLISDKTQVKVVIDPIVLTSKKVECSSKFNSFSFSKQHSMYITYKEDLEELLLYLKEKYSAMEIANVSEKPLKKYVDSSQEFNKHLQYISVPFLIVGIILSILLMIPLDNLLLDILTYPTILLYCTLLFAAFSNYLKKTREITKGFYSSLYETPITVKKTNISSLGEKLEKRYLEQFLYEFDTKKQYRKLKKSKKKENISSKQRQPKERKKTKRTEKEPLNTSSKKKAKEENEELSDCTEDPDEPLKKKIAGEINPENYSFFLED